MPEQDMSWTSNQLVIYFDKTTPENGRRIQLDEFVLISNAAAATGQTLDKAAKATEILQKVGDMVHKAEPEQEAVPSVVNREIVGTIIIDFIKAGTFEGYTSKVDSDFNPWKETKIETIKTDKGDVIITTTKTDYPLFSPTEEQQIEVIKKNPPEPVKVEMTPPTTPPEAGVPEPGVPDAGIPDAGVPDAGIPEAGVPEDLRNKPKLVPENEPWVDAALVDPFLEIMDNYGKMHFSTSSAAQAYLDYQLQKAGIELKTAATSMRELGYAGTKDPAGVEGQMRNKGIQDEHLIAQVREEANDVIKRFEATLLKLQEDLSGENPENTKDPNDPQDFSALIAEWNERFSSEFSTDLPDAIKGREPAMWNITNGVVTLTVPYASTQEIEKISPTGLIIRAGIGVKVSDTPISDVPGFYPSSIVSVFDEEVWKLEA